MPPPQPGQPFPAVSLLTTGNKVVQVPADLRGRPAVLAWYPFAFSPVCTEEFTGLAKVQRDLQHLAHVATVSCDHWYTTNAYGRSMGCDFPFLSDWSKAASRTLGLLDEALGRPGRAIYVLDGDGVVRWMRNYEIRACPKVEDFLPALKALA